MMIPTATLDARWSSGPYHAMVATGNPRKPRLAFFLSGERRLNFTPLILLRLFLQIMDHLTERFHCPAIVRLQHLGF